jgi:serine/threonine protein kinase
MNKLIGEYYITKKIGKGEYGNVYLGTHIKTKQKLAVKSVDRRLM